jgi:hypothetical protein
VPVVRKVLPAVLVKKILNQELDDLLTPREVAAKLRTSVDVLCVLRHKRVGPPYLKLGRKVLYRRSAVAEFLAKKEVAS